jgi:hypothetical protein
MAYGTGLASSHNMTPVTDTMGADNGTNTWNWSHQTSGGWNGRNFMRYDRWGDENGDPQVGFLFNTGTVAPPGGWIALAESSTLYLRFRVRWNAPLTLSGLNSSAQMKWFLFGGPGLADGNDRMILFWERATDGTYGAGTDDTTQVTVRMGAGVSAAHCEAVVPVGSWVHVQAAWRYTDAGTPFQRLYVNNNTEGSPTAENTDFSSNAGGTWDAPESWTGGHWAETVSSNSYTGTDAQLDIMDFEIDDAFDASWYPG